MLIVKRTPIFATIMTIVFVVTISSLIFPNILPQLFAFTTNQSASLVIGQTDFIFSSPGTTVSNIFGPQGLTFDSAGNLWVADGSNNRILEYLKGSGFTTGQAASLVIGQTDFTSGGSGTSASNINFPAGITFDSSGNLWVVDFHNNRILQFTAILSTGQSASLVIGQTDFTSGGSGTTTNTLTGPRGLTFDSTGNLWVADGSNNRILEYLKGSGFTTGQAASLVIGQTDFTSGGSGTSASNFTSPRSLTFDSAGNLWIADQSNHRILEYLKGSGFTTGQAASLVIGQTDFTSGGSGTTASTLNFPRGLTFDSAGNLWVAEASNNRILEYLKGSGFTTGQAASLVIGQTDFTSGGSGTTANKLNGPLGLTFDSAGNLWVAEQNNNRILKFTAPLATSPSDSIGITDQLSTVFTSTSIVGSGGTATTTLPAGTTASITLPSGQSGTVTIQTTTAPTTGSGGSTLDFVGDVIDIVPPTNACATGCVFSFDFTSAQVTAAGLTDPSQVEILHDRNNDGDFDDAGETLATTITTTSPGHFTATATDFFTSKFAIGGVVPALAILGSVGGGSAPPPSFTLYNLVQSSSVPNYIKQAILNHDPHKPIAPSNDPSVPYYPLSIDGNGYLLGGYTNTLQTVTEKTNTPVDLQLVTTADSIQHLALYTDLHGTDPKISDSDTYVIYDKGQPLQVVDPHKLFSGVTFDLVKSGSQYKIDYGIKFAKTMSASDIILRAWNENHVSSDVNILDAWQVVQGSSSQSTIGEDVTSTTIQNTMPQNEKPSIVTDNSVNMLPTIKDWGGYSSNPISDSEFLSHMGIVGQSIPQWVAIPAKYAVNGDLTPQEFEIIVKYLASQGIIK
jgi:sugar lactone lactonase YvrE